MTFSLIVLYGTIAQALCRSAASPEALVYNAATRAFVRQGRTCRLTPQQAGLVLLLAGRAGGMVLQQEIVEFMCRGREDGGALAPMNQVHVTMTKCRPALRELGVEVRGRYWAWELRVLT